MKILYVAYPLLPVSDATAGGAEQILWTLEREMSRRGHETVVAACGGSRVSGRLYPTGGPPLQADTFETRNREHHAAILNLLQREAFDLINDHSGSFFGRCSGIPTPVLATLHMPRDFYSGIDLGGLALNVRLNCVSESQRGAFSDVPGVAGVLRNGIALDRFGFQPSKGDYLLWLGRICEEKGAHLAIDAARRAGRRIIVAGQVYPFTYHQAYFRREIVPRLGPAVEFVDSPDSRRKAELLGNASALLISSMAEETSSLVALEAFACGTPVIAFPRGAIRSIVRPGESGFLVNSVEEMAEAVSLIDSIHSLVCRQLVEQEYSAARMAADYEGLYCQLAPYAVTPGVGSVWGQPLPGGLDSP